MKKLLLLLRMSRLGMLRPRKTGSRLRQRMGTVGFTLLAVLVYGVIAAYAVMLGVGLNYIGLLSAYPTMIVTITSVMILISCIARAPGTLFRAQDFDLVMSLPVSGRVVAAARVLELYALNLLYTVGIMLPAGVTYAVLAQPAATFYAYYALSMLLAPLVPVLVGAALGALAHMASAAFRHTRIVSLVFTFTLTLAIMLGSYAIGFMSEQFTPEMFLNLARTVSGVFERMYPPVVLFAAAVTEGSFAAFAGFAGLSLAAFALMIVVFGRWFVALNTLVNTRFTRKNFRLEAQRAKSPRAALLGREARRYFASNIYVMNTGFGLVLSLLGSGALLFIDMSTLMVLMEMTGYERIAYMLVPFMVAFLVGTASTTGSSISLEGKQLWIARSLPVPAMDYLMAKVRLNLRVVLPFVAADAVLLAFALRMSPVAAVLSLLLPLAVAVFTALCGLLSNLKWHRFDWTNETTIVKQSFAAFLPVLLGILLTMAPCALTIITPALNYALVPILTTVGVAGIDVILYAILRKNAEKWVRQL